ncbi:MAG: glycine--tRNA ligase subunit beta [Thermodesulfobacteriota bacterium]
MNTLLLEIGTEEIPAGYIAPALTALAGNLVQRLDGLRIEHGIPKTYGTPRRLTVEIQGVAKKQLPLTTTITGPPRSVAFDSSGKPTVAAQKFSEKVGISVARLSIRELEKGAYLCADKVEPGKSSKEVLASILPELILATPFPKAMRWAGLDISFARPIHTILAMLGRQVIPVTLGNVKSAPFTMGHAFMKPGKIRIGTPEEYEKKLRSAHVIADIRERRRQVEKEITKAARKLKGEVLQDEDLLDIVTNLVEYPVASVGKFDPVYLSLPREILITAMREHQKYFALVDKKGDLMPFFIAVNNTRTKNAALAARGHERVIRARLADAKFFFESDRQESLDTWVERLNGVLFQADLGTMHEKVRRVRQIAEFLSDEAGLDADLKKTVSRAAWICKADLVSRVVGEFPKLQGVMGRVYSKLAGEAPLTGDAVEEHYRPTFSGGLLPQTISGALLGIADKLDTICGSFHAGLIPTGASDPYALRRQGIGIVQIMLNRGFPFSLKKLIEKSLSFFSGEGKGGGEEISEKIYAFLQNRMMYMLSEEGFSKDTIQAVMEVSGECIPDVWARVKALERLRELPDFEPLAVAFKRVVNIIRQSGYKEKRDVNPVLFQEACEGNLLSAFQKVNSRVEGHLRKGDFKNALLEIAMLRKPVDAFFDGVLVMAEDEKIRINRLALLAGIASLFDRFADFGKIST